MKGIIGTAGHIDHGKTALIGALTGEQTDRLPEEQRRGISIDLGFSHLEVEDRRLGIVDVPGHEDFIRNMLAGATGIDVLLLVVAADEGVMPQTREHTAIAELLGVDRAVVALTKTDLVDDEWLGLVHDDVAGFLADTPFAGAPMIPTSATTGEGVEELRGALATVFRGARGRTDDLFRLPVDRAFTVRGTGTVVTGTVWSGRLERDSTVRLIPGGPAARVKALQVHGADVDAVEAGERAAIALTGVDRGDVGRGMTLVSDDAWTDAHVLTIRLRVLPDRGWTVEPRQRVRVHLGTAEVMARTVLLDRDGPLAPGEEGWAQLRLEAPLVARTGDRVVIRSYSPVTTIGGGRVVEPHAPRRTTTDAAGRRLLLALYTGDADTRVGAILDDAGSHGVPTDSLPILAGATPGEVATALQDTVRIADRAFAAEAAAAVRDRLVTAVARFHDAHHLQVGMDPEALRRSCEGADPSLVQHALDALLEHGTLVARAGRIARAGWEVKLGDEDAALREQVAATLAGHGETPPRIDELAAALGHPRNLKPILETLERDGRVVRIEHDLFMDAAALQRIVRGVRDRFGGSDGVSPAEFRAVIDVSRKHLMPILAYLDRTGVTARSGEGRSVSA